MMLIGFLIRGECEIHFTNLYEPKVGQFINWNNSVPTIDSENFQLIVADF